MEIIKSDPTLTLTERIKSDPILKKKLSDWMDSLPPKEMVFDYLDEFYQIVKNYDRKRKLEKLNKI